MTHIGHMKNGILCKIFDVLCKILFLYEKSTLSGAFQDTNT